MLLLYLTDRSKLRDNHLKRANEILFCEYVMHIRVYEECHVVSIYTDYSKSVIFKVPLRSIITLFS